MDRLQDIASLALSSLKCGIIRSTTASSLLGMSTAWPTPFRIYQDVEKKITTNHIQILPTPNKLQYTRYNDKLFITTPEQTIVDLIIEEIEERFIFESIESYMDDNGEPYLKLISLAEEYNVKEEVLRYIKEVTEEYQ